MISKGRAQSGGCITGAEVKASFNLNQSTEDEPPKEATAKDQPTQQVKAIAEDEPPAEEEPPKEDEPPAAIEETLSYIMQKKKLKVSAQGILKKLTKNWKTAPVSKVIAAKKAPATTVDTAGKATAAEMAPATTTEKSSAAEKSHAASGEEIEIEDETEEELERQEELQRDEELTRILRGIKPVEELNLSQKSEESSKNSKQPRRKMVARKNQKKKELEENQKKQEYEQSPARRTRSKSRDVKLSGISAIATAAVAIAENLPTATTPKKPGRPRVATAVAEKPVEKIGRTRAAVIGKAGQKGAQKRPAASAKSPAKKNKSYRSSAL
ncbi:uncharacterized protein LOC110696914 [Chenopodium quinoa]|uniref:uncharacterized protein LOC110696914 n=1 Tax=Chenopodium quinoa TaxID=63459 RepID=UPI000B7754D7|nr:uncharacterized protein LOC110696914 [Chenopodium quinoa]